jgi:hypothetical protein
MKNIHVLPTENPSRLMIDTIENKLYYQPILHNKTVNVLTQHIYITSDEEIKEDDWGLSKLNEVILFGRSYNEKFYKKIILTTDQDLIADGVQAIDNEFLEWFVKNPSCEYVDVVKEMYMPQSNGKISDGKITHELSLNESLNTLPFYRIIITQEKPKQEIVINEKCSKCGSSQYQIGKPFCTDEFCNTNIGKASEDYWLKQPYNEDAFVEGAKWQQEQDKNKYSEEEVEAIWKFALYSAEQHDKFGTKNKSNFITKDVKEFIEQFKKKD